jgi:hypothetical protein
LADGITWDSMPTVLVGSGIAVAHIDQIRERFGSAAIGPASAMTSKGFCVVRKGSQQWDPEQD